LCKPKFNFSSNPAPLAAFEEIHPHGPIYKLG